MTAGASAPEELVQQVVARLREWGGTTAEELEGPRGTRGVLAAARAARSELEMGTFLTYLQQSLAG